jgi:stage III sporulation protein AF
MSEVSNVDFLKDWVRGLVLLVVLATCLELMLPMNAMKKYVRMTMGLLVVLAVIQPLLGFMGQTVTVTNLFPDDDGAALPTINQIMTRAGQFREKNQTLALGEARVRLAAEAVQAARAVPGVAEARAAVVLEQERGEYRVRSVTVTVTPGGAPGTVSQVKPVPPVRIGGGEEALPAGERQPSREPSGADRSLADSVRSQVAARLGLTDPAPVRVAIDQTPEGGNKR